MDGEEDRWCHLLLNAKGSGKSRNNNKIRWLMPTTHHTVIAASSSDAIDDAQR
jgi:hypothetical protein